MSVEWQAKQLFAVQDSICILLCFTVSFLLKLAASRSLLYIYIIFSSLYSTSASYFLVYTVHVSYPYCTVYHTVSFNVECKEVIKISLRNHSPLLTLQFGAKPSVKFEIRNSKAKFKVEGEIRIWKEYIKHCVKFLPPRPNDHRPRPASESSSFFSLFYLMTRRENNMCCLKKEVTVYRNPFMQSLERVENFECGSDFGSHENPRCHH